MTEFFLEKFTFDHFSNLKLIELFEELKSEISDYSIKSMSHILNVHHIWIQRLEFQKPESLEWDILPIDYFAKFQHLNFLQTTNFIQFASFSDMIGYKTSEDQQEEKSVSDILFHILNHNTHHRAQIILDLKNLGLTVPSMNFISFK